MSSIILNYFTTENTEGEGGKLTTKQTKNTKGGEGNSQDRQDEAGWGRMMRGGFSCLQGAD